MERGKIDNFKRGSSVRQFPQFLTLEEQDTAAIRARLATRLDADPASEPLDLVVELTKRPWRDLGNVMDAERVDWRQLLRAEGIELRELLLVNWYRFDEVDVMRVDDLANSFSDLWYAGADDIDLFQEDCEWILSVEHDGDVRLRILAGGG